jgi:hypothetical protein
METLASRGKDLENNSGWNRPAKLAAEKITIEIKTKDALEIPKTSQGLTTSGSDPAAEDTDSYS